MKIADIQLWGDEMQWYESVPCKMMEGESYSHKTLVNWLQKERPNLSSGGYHWAIDQLVYHGDIIRKGYDEYSKADGIERSIYSPVYSDHALNSAKKINEKFPYVAFTVFETALMNGLLNHLIGQNTVFLQVEKESSIYIFRYLQEEEYPNLLYKPSVEELYLYWNKEMTVVTDLISEAPLRKDQPHMIMLEKMLVDMCADKLIASTFSKAELPDVFDQAFERYKMDCKRMMRYARRRNRGNEIRSYLEGAGYYAEK